MDDTRDWSAEIGLVADQVVNCYIHRDVAERIADILKSRLAAGDYAKQLTEAQLAEAVTADMQSVNGDHHLYLSHTSKFLPELPDPVLHDGGRDPRLAELGGHGFTKVERLAGNVGLLEIRRFYDPTLSGAAAVAAMNLVAGCDALIIDLRRNSGGEPEMVALVHSYLVEERTQLNSVYFPSENRTIQFWTLPYVPGARFGGSKPIYVLISHDTFSGGEGFSYDLQQYRRATLMGDPTRGGANFHFPMRVADHLLSAIPTGFPVQAVSGGNWEGVGVQPDIPVPAPAAFEAAYRRALADVLALGADGPRQHTAQEARLALDELSHPAPGSGA